MQNARCGILKREVREMREKMRNHLGNKQRDLFDIKTDEGGITDIEFIAQYLVLRYAPGEPRLTRWSDNVRIFELMANYDIMPEEEARALTQAYVTMRDGSTIWRCRSIPARSAAGCSSPSASRCAPAGPNGWINTFCGYSGGLW